MAIFRFIGLVLIVLALMLLGADVVSTLENNGEAVIRSLDRILRLAGVDAKTWLQQQLAPLAANTAIAILSWPGWAVLGAPGAILGILGAPRRERRPLAPPLPPSIDR